MRMSSSPGPPLRVPTFSASSVPCESRSDLAAVVIRPGYLDGHWTRASWTDQGVRDKVGATHLPLPALFHAYLDAGLTLERFTEGGELIPTVLAVRARKSR
jgi:hypothetical protein